MEIPNTNALMKWLRVLLSVICGLERITSGSSTMFAHKFRQKIVSTVFVFTNFMHTSFRELKTAYSTRKNAPFMKGSLVEAPIFRELSIFAVILCI